MSTGRLVCIMTLLVAGNKLTRAGNREHQSQLAFSMIASQAWRGFDYGPYIVVHTLLLSPLAISISHLTEDLLLFSPTHLHHMRSNNAARPSKRIASLLNTQALLQQAGLLPLSDSLPSPTKELTGTGSAQRDIWRSFKKVTTKRRCVALAPSERETSTDVIMSPCQFLPCYPFVGPRPAGHAGPGLG